MRFVDEAIIRLKAGDGGAGLAHFRREKFVPMGGPDGGDGGNGGSVIIKADSSKSTLLDISFQPIWEAESGGKGSTSNKTGKSGEDLIISVPPGTQILKSTNKDLIADLVVANQEFLIAKGGRGGKGNTHFKSSTNRAPEVAQKGTSGQEGEYILSLKLVADIGIIGLPNAGKSTLISRISAAKPKIADYPFTTLVPNLGVVKPERGRSFVAADIPGLVEGAAEGKGLGIAFLKHVDRTRVLLHLIDSLQAFQDLEDGDALKSFTTVEVELDRYSAELGGRKRILAFSKADLIPDAEDRQRLVKAFPKDIPLLFFSSATGEGLPELVTQVGELLEELAEPKPESSEGATQSL